MAVNDSIPDTKFCNEIYVSFTILIRKANPSSESMVYLSKADQAALDESKAS